MTDLLGSDVVPRMFTIIGGDGKEYGPVTADQVRNWIATGRANLDTKAKAVGSEEWRRLGDFPEFNHAPTVPLNAGVNPIPTGSEDLADRGVRLCAVLIDAAIAFVAMAPGAIFLGAEFLRMLIAAGRGGQPDFDELSAGRGVLGGALLLLFVSILVVVQIVMISTRGQSIGKRLLGIRIVRLRDGGQAGFVHGWLLRTFVPGLIGCVPGIGSLFLLVDKCFIFREDRRCLHDLMADTKVVRVAPTSARP